MEKQLGRIERLREDLRLQIQELKPNPGSVLVITPKNDQHIMTDTYMGFVADTLQSLIGNQVKFLVLPNNQLQITEQK